MNINEVTDREAVLSAIREFDDIGETAFLSKYGFGPARSYHLVHQGRLYPSKAMLAAAYGYQFPDADLPTAADFSGGKATVVPVLQRLDFVVDSGLSAGQLEERFAKLATSTLDGRPTPHKYLLLLMALGDLEAYGERLRAVVDVAAELARVLSAALPTVQNPSSWEPIWRLETDLWEVVGDDGDPRNAGYSDPPVGLLKQPGMLCGLREDVADLLLSDNVLLQTVRCTLLQRLTGTPDEAISLVLDSPAAAAPRTWWVNQGQTFPTERSGGFLWARALQTDGTAARHHLAVRLLQPGDLVVHYSQGIVALSRVTSLPRRAQRPGEVEDSSDGYLVTVDYHDLETPIALDDLTGRPTGEGPFNKNGGVNQGYLFPLSTEWAHQLHEQFNHRWPVGSPWSPRQHWLFQANPRVWSLAERLQTWAVGEIEDWSLVQHRGAVRDGDDVALFSSGTDGGILAIGTLVGEPFERPRPAWRSEGPDVERAIKVRLTRRFDSPISRSQLRDHDVLRNMAVMKFANATNFPVTDTEWSAIMALVSEPTSSTLRCLAVYVGKMSEANLQHALPDGRWGFKTNQTYYDDLQVGDLVLIGSGFTGGSPRVDADDFLQHGLRRLIVGRVTSGISFDNTPYWPDEKNAGASYPYRFTFEQVDELSNVDNSTLDLRFEGPVADAIRRSAINQGRGELVSITAGAAPTAVTLRDVVDQYAADLRAIGYHYGQARHDLLVRTFITSLCTKRFVILTGLSGSGKTKLAQNFGNWLGDHNLQIVAVRPDWTNPDPLLGYEDGLSELKDGQRAWHVPVALEFMLRAIAHPHQPYLLLLDEMNLAHVERYFADVLSGMESHHPVVPNLTEVDGEWRIADTTQPRLPLPSNLFIVGTVNVDETTYMFSPKVLDRANTIEFRVHTNDLMAPSAPNARIQRAPAGHIAAFLNAASTAAAGTALGTSVETWLLTLHRDLSTYGREFGHRTYAEAIRFANLLAAAGESDASVAFDLQVLQKVLPKYHGSVRELSEALNALGARCFVGPDATALDIGFDPTDDSLTDAALPLSFDKVRRMAKRLRANHFVSFAE